MRSQDFPHLRHRSYDRRYDRFTWILSEKQASGLWVARRVFDNLITNYGLSVLSGAETGTFVAATWLVIDTSAALLSLGYSMGTMSIQATFDPTLTTDTTLTIGAGLPTQEVVGIYNNAGGGSFTLNSPGLVNAHGTGEYVVRTPTAGDTIASIVAEGQYDPTFNANKRTSTSGNYSPGFGQTVLQFFIAGTQATNLLFSHVGLADNVNVGQGNLHNYATLGYNHNNPNDFEIDILHTFTAA